MSDELEWFKSSYSGPEGDACLEIAFPSANVPVAVRVRDSKDPAGPSLSLSAPAWSAFIAAVQPGA